MTTEEKFSMLMDSNLPEVNEALTVLINALYEAKFLAANAE
jgi:hypothetical protein